MKIFIRFEIWKCQRWCYVRRAGKSLFNSFFLFFPLLSFFTQRHSFWPAQCMTPVRDAYALLVLFLNSFIFSSQRLWFLVLSLTYLSFIGTSLAFFLWRLGKPQKCFKEIITSALAFPQFLLIQPNTVSDNLSHFS